MGAWTVAIAALVGVAILVGLRQAFLAHTRRPSTAVISSKSTQGVYVERWHLLWNPKRLMIVLHRFSGVDLDAPHNHLGYSLTWVLRGEGIETLYDTLGREVGQRRLRRGRFYLRTPKDIHRVDSVPTPSLVTLFILVPFGNPWGFFTSQGFMDAQTYCRSPLSDKVFRWTSNRKPGKPQGG